MSNRVCVFAHYDKDNLVDEYVYYYLNELISVVQKLIFVTVSDISDKDIKRLSNFNIDVIKRENIGYDFYSYKIGIEQLDLSRYDELIICNDSVFGPLIPLKKVFVNMDKKKCDFWGITENYQYSYHIQSYFICFRSRVITSKVFYDFWKGLEIINDKNELIQLYEIGISKLLIDEKFVSASYVVFKPTIYDKTMALINWNMPVKYKPIRILKMPFSKYYWDFILNPIDITIKMWDKIITFNSMPFMKRSLFTLNRMMVKKHEYKNIINNISDYPIELITNYLNRNVKNDK